MRAIFLKLVVFAASVSTESFADSGSRELFGFLKKYVQVNYEHEISTRPRSYNVVRAAWIGCKLNPSGKEAACTLGDPGDDLPDDEFDQSWEERLTRITLKGKEGAELVRKIRKAFPDYEIFKSKYFSVFGIQCTHGPIGHQGSYQCFEVGHGWRVFDDEDQSEESGALGIR